MTIKTNDRFRVALVSFNFGEYCVQLANALARDADVLLILPDRIVGRHASRLDPAVRLFSVADTRIRQAYRQFRTISAILRAIKDFSPHVVHYQGIHLWFDLALLLLHRYPLVFTIHDFRPHPGDQPLLQTPFCIEMYARSRANQIIVHTQHTRGLAARELPAHADCISVIPHIQIGGGLGATAISEEDNLVLFFGRIWEYKGLEYLIRAEPLITARVAGARFLIAGHGEDFGRYARMMVNPSRFVVHNEFISDQLAAEYFQRASVVVLPYTEASQSGVIPIAYSAGKPVVATTVGGLPEMVEHGRTGYLVAPRDIVQLADAVSALLLDAPLRRQMGLNGKHKVQAECSPQVIAQKTMDVYRRALAGTARLPKRMQVRLAATAQQGKASSVAKP